MIYPRSWLYITLKISPLIAIISVGTFWISAAAPSGDRTSRGELDTLLNIAIAGCVVGILLAIAGLIGIRCRRGTTPGHPGDRRQHVASPLQARRQAARRMKP